MNGKTITAILITIMLAIAGACGTGFLYLNSSIAEAKDAGHEQAEFVRQEVKYDLEKIKDKQSVIVHQQTINTQQLSLILSELKKINKGN